MPPPLHHTPAPISGDSSTTLTGDSPPFVFRRDFPEIPTMPSRKRTTTALSISDSSDHEAGPSTKRRRKERRTSPLSEGSHAAPIEIEDIDLTEDPTPLKDALQKQREEQIKAQKEESNQPPSLTKFTCVICMDSPTDLTATACGHLFCHFCLIEALKAGEARRTRPNETKKTQCPICRKNLDRKQEMKDVIPLLFMRKGSKKKTTSA